MAELIKIAAPRTEPYDVNDPQSRIAFAERDRRHPANEAFALPAGELVLSQGDGVDGDPARANNPNGNPPLTAYPTPAVVAAIREGKLIEVRSAKDLEPAKLSESDLGSLTSLTPRQIKAIKTGLRVENVEHLADKVASSPNPSETLTGIAGIGPATARDLLNELEARDLIESLSE